MGGQDHEKPGMCFPKKFVSSKHHRLASSQSSLAEELKKVGSPKDAVDMEKHESGLVGDVDQSLHEEARCFVDVFYCGQANDHGDLGLS